MATFKIDITGQRFGELIVLKRDIREDKSRNMYWLCKCDCGKEKAIRSDALRKGVTKSCGCKMAGHRYDYTMPYGEAQKRRLFKKYLFAAQYNKREFKITYEEFLQITQKDCYYCGDKPSTIAKGPRGDYIYNGIDRINNNKGYLLDNIVPCCKICNIIKGRLNSDLFQKQVIKIAKHLL